MTFKSVLAPIALVAFSCLLGCQSSRCHQQCSCQPACGCQHQTSQPEASQWETAPTPPVTTEPDIPAYEEAPIPEGVNEAPPAPKAAPATEPEKLPAPAAAAAQIWRARDNDPGVRIVPR